MQKLLLYVLLLTAILFSACREEIIDPSNPVSNINEPVQNRTSSSYSFAINAFEINKQVVNFTQLYTTRNRVLITSDSYKDGSVEIMVMDQNSSSVYEFNVSSDEAGVYSSIIGSSPQKVWLNFKNFTGRFKIEISPLY